MVKMIMMLLVLGLSVSCGFEIVDPGHRGVKVVLGEVQIKDGAYPEGIHFYNPFTTSIKELDVRENVTEISTMAYTRDMQNVNVVAKVNISLEPNAVPHVYQSIGEEWQGKLVHPVLSSKIKEVLGQYDAEKLVSDRRSATDGIRDLLKEELQSRNVIVTNFELVNLDFNDQFEKAIEAKVVATQRALEAINKTKQIEEEAKQKVIQATSEAEAMKIKTQALQQNKALVEYEAVLRWDGKLPTYMMGDKAMPFINIGNK